MRDTSEDCKYCGAEGPWDFCVCGFSRYFNCSDKNNCGDCEEAHKAIGRYVLSLLKSKVSSRSNSRRARLFHGLYTALACLNKEQPAFYSTFLLKDVSPFDPDWRFRAGVLKAVRSTKLNKKFADQLYYDPNGEVTTALLMPVLSAMLQELRG